MAIWILSLLLRCIYSLLYFVLILALNRKLCFEVRITTLVGATFSFTLWFGTYWRFLDFFYFFNCWQFNLINVFGIKITIIGEACCLQFWFEAYLMFLCLFFVSWETFISQMWFKFWIAKSIRHIYFYFNYLKHMGITYFFVDILEFLPWLESNWPNCCEGVIWFHVLKNMLCYFVYKYIFFIIDMSWGKNVDLLEHQCSCIILFGE